jgi:hypothetical protein
MNNSKLQSICFDGALSFNNPTEILDYVMLLSVVDIDDDENCIIDGKSYYYNDLVTPMFDIFVVMSLKFPDLTLEEKNVIHKIQSFMDYDHYKSGSSRYLSVDDLYADTENNTQIIHLYELLGGNNPATENHDE